MGGLKRSIILSAIVILGVTWCPFVFANPTDGQVSGGEAAISHPNATTTQVDQTTQKAIIDWQKFNIAPHETTQFNQPNSSAIILNRVNGMNGGSQIMGQMKANGQIWIINPAGILFGKGAQVNAAGLFATTSDIKNEDFMAGNYKFTANPLFSNGAIINEGTIEVQRGGLVGLVGARVENKGVIRAQMGTVLLGGAEAYALDFDGDQLINFVIEKKSSTNSVKNSGQINVSPGQMVMVATGAAKAIVEHAINMTGVKEATHISMQGGVIVLDGGEGSVTASGNMQAAGGLVAIKGKHVTLNTAEILTSSQSVGGVISLMAQAHLSIQDTMLVANSEVSGGTIKALSSGNIVVTSSTLSANGSLGGGEILIGGNAYGLGPEINALNTLVDSNTTIAANALWQGQGGKIVIWSDGGTYVYGNVSAQGGALGGNGGWIETSGHYLDVNGITISTAAPHGLLGTWLLDPTNIYIALTPLSAIAAGMSGLDASASIDLGINPTIYQASGAVQDSLLTTLTLQTSLALTNVVVTTTNASGTGLGNITIVDPVIWATGNTLTLTAANNIAINATVTTGTAASALILDAAGTVTQTASIAGSGGVTQLRGTVQLSRANTYTGATTVSGGAMVVSNATGMGTAAGGVSVASGATLTINGVAIGAEATTLNGGTLSATGTASLAGDVTLGAASTIQATSGSFTLAGDINNGGFLATFDANGGTLAASGVISNGGGLTKSGTTSLTLSSNNTYSGITNVDAGTLIASHAAALGATSAGTAIASGATLHLNGVTVGAEAITLNGGTLLGTGTASLAGNVTLGAASTIQATSGAFTLAGDINNGGFLASFDASGGTLAASGVMSNGGGLTKSGSNSLTLSGNNTYTGNTSIDAGTLIASHAAALGATSAGAAIASGATLHLNGVTVGAEAITLNGGTLLGTGTASLSGNVTLGAASTIQATSGAFTLAGDINNGGFLASFDASGGTLAASGVMSNGGGLTKSGSNSLTLSGNNTYSGNTSIDAGTLIASHAAALGATSAGAAIASGATLHLNGVTVGAEAITLNGGSLLGSGTASLAGDITQGAASLIQATSGTFTLAGNIDNGGFLATFDANSGDVIASGVINNTGGLTKTGTGRLVLSGLNVYSGITTVTSGMVSFNSIANLGGGPNALGEPGSVLNGTIAVGANATLQYTGTGHSSDRVINLTGNNVVLDASGSGPLSLSGGITSSGVGVRNLILTGSGNASESGVISSAGGLTKNGTGAWTLAGANTYANATNITNGSLIATHSGALSNGAINITPSTSVVATLALSGINSLTNSNTITLNSTVAGSTAALSLGTMTLSNTLLFNGSNDVINVGVGQTATLTGTLDGTAFGQGVLTLQGGGTVNLNGIVGGGNALSSLTSSLSTSLGINTTGISTTGNQTYNGVVSSLAGTTFTSAGGDISLANAGNNFSALSPLSFAGVNTATVTNLNGITLGSSDVASLTLTAGGAIAQTGPLTVSGTATFSAGANAITLTNSGNAFTGSVSFNNAGPNDVVLTNIGGLSLNLSSVGSGAFTVNNTGNLTVSGAVSSTGVMTLTSTATLTLNNTLSGGPITLSSQIFTNNAGSTALTPSAGNRFLVYSVNPATDTRGGLSYDFKQYNITYPTAPAQSTGNGFLYSVAPTLTPALIGPITKVFDGTTSATVSASHYSVIGAIDGDINMVLTQTSANHDTPFEGTNKNVTVTGISFVSGTSSLAEGSGAVYGYQVSPSSTSAAVGIVTASPPPPPSVSASSSSISSSVSEPVINSTVIGSMANGILSVNFVTNTFVDPYPVGVPVNGSVVVTLAPATANYLTMNTFPLSFASSTQVSGLPRLSVEGRGNNSMGHSLSGIKSLMHAYETRLSITFHLCLGGEDKCLIPPVRSSLIDEVRELREEGTASAKKLWATFEDDSISLPYTMPFSSFDNLSFQPKAVIPAPLI